MAATDPQLGTRLPPDVDRRLRLYVQYRREPLSRVLTDVLREALPQADALNEALAQQAEALAQQLRTAAKGDAADDLAS